MKKIIIFILGMFVISQISANASSSYGDNLSTTNEYSRDTSSENGNLSDYYENNPSPARRIRNYFFGQPTGFTPPVHNLPFNDYGQPYGINRSFYNNRGSYHYNNETPANAGLGVRILDD